MKRKERRSSGIQIAGNGKVFFFFGSQTNNILISGCFFFSPSRASALARLQYPDTCSETVSEGQRDGGMEGRAPRRGNAELNTLRSNSVPQEQHP